MSRRSHTYRDHCAELKHGVFSARDVFRCEHFKKWFSILQKDDYCLFLALGFENWVQFTNHHTDCDNGATTRSLTKARIICDPDEPCRHKGYHALYPRLNNAFSRRRRCFRVLPSSSRFDITDDIESKVCPGDDVATWAPLAILLFSQRDKAQVNTRKKKRQNHYEISVPLKWDQEMKKTLDRVELLQLAFDDQNDITIVCEDFGNMSVEAVALRTIRDLVAPELVKPSSTLEYGTWDWRSPDAVDFKKSVTDLPSVGMSSSPGQQGEFTNHNTSQASSKNTRVLEDTCSTDRKNPLYTDEAEREKFRDCIRGPIPDQIENPSIVGEIPVTAQGTESVSSHTEDDVSEDEDLLPPPIKRRRSMPQGEAFSYTKKPSTFELKIWNESWKLFRKAQEFLKRGPSANNSENMGNTNPKGKEGQQRRFYEETRIHPLNETDDEGELSDWKYRPERRKAFSRKFTFGTSEGALRTQKPDTDDEDE